MILPSVLLLLLWSLLGLRLLAYANLFCMVLKLFLLSIYRVFSAHKIPLLALLVVTGKRHAASNLTTLKQLKRLPVDARIKFKISNNHL